MNGKVIERRELDGGKRGRRSSASRGRGNYDAPANQWRRESRSVLFSAIFCVGAVVGFSTVMPLFEQRSGVVLADPLLAVLPSLDLTVPIFVVIYCTLVVSLVLLARFPERFAHVLRAYGVMVVVRIVALWAAPLDPPHGMVLLNDPVASMGPGGALTRDLFFSGHTATLVLMALVVPQRRARIVVGCLTIVMVAMLLLQHVHYTIDILVAPFVAWGAVTLTRRRARVPAPPQPPIA